MTISVVAVAVLKWMSAHPAETVMAVGAVASLVAKPLEKVPFIGKLMSILAKAGVDLPGLWANIMNKAPALVAKEAAAEAAKLEGK